MTLNGYLRLSAVLHRYVYNSVAWLSMRGYSLKFVVNVGEL